MTFLCRPEHQSSPPKCKNVMAPNTISRRRSGKHQTYTGHAASMLLLISWCGMPLAQAIGAHCSCLYSTGRKLNRCTFTPHENGDRKHTAPRERPCEPLGPSCDCTWSHRVTGHEAQKQLQGLPPELPRASCFMLYVMLYGKHTGTVCICSTAHLPWGNLIMLT